MWQTVRDKYLAFHASFHGSEVIIWSRAQVALGAIGAGLLLVDPMAFNLDPKWAAAWVAANGALSEYLRRRGASYEDDGSIK